MYKLPTIDILLATYNGENYLEELISSLLDQTCSNWQLIVRDDGSTDATLQIIQKYIKANPGKIRLLDDGRSRLGSTLSFSSLLENSHNEYIMLCDQDDVWFKNKIEITLEAMLRLEEEYKEIPLMVFTDLVEVDENLNPISGSFIKSQKLFPSVISDPVKLSALNVVAGCTTMINKKALDYILPVTSGSVTHDQWMAVIIARYGRIKFLPVPTIFYRQHSSNVHGAKEIGFSYFGSKLKEPVNQFRIYHSLLTGLPFRINLLKFLFYKILFTVRRLII
ncbi:MAG: glycosyltransferase family 2 protein [Mangrovibacterium sp.]